MNQNEANTDSIRELNDEQLEEIVGGVEIGQTVQIKSTKIDYCPNCGKLLLNYSATITGLRGVLDGKNVYWITRDCCGYKTSAIVEYFHKPIRRPRKKEGGEFFIYFPARLCYHFFRREGLFSCFGSSGIYFWFLPRSAFSPSAADMP